jgi:hypothetical protein
VFKTETVGAKIPLLLSSNWFSLKAFEATKPESLFWIFSFDGNTLFKFSIFIDDEVAFVNALEIGFDWSSSTFLTWIDSWSIIDEITKSFSFGFNIVVVVLESKDYYS